MNFDMVSETMSKFSDEGGNVDITEKRKRAIESGDYPEIDDTEQHHDLHVGMQVALSEDLPEEGFDMGEEGYIIGFGWKDGAGNPHALVEVPGTDPTWLPCVLLEDAR